MKQKTGRKLLSFLLTLAMLVGLMPGMGLTAYAADEVSENISLVNGQSLVLGTHYSVSGEFENESGIHVYNKGPMTINARKGETITKVVLTYSWGNNKSSLSASAGTFDGNATISDINAQQVTISSSNTSGVKISAVRVYFEGSLSNPTVTLTGGANAKSSGGLLTQSYLLGAMDTVTYTALTGATFPAFENFTQNGVTVERTSDTVVTVSGTPTANTEITVPDAESSSKIVTWGSSIIKDSGKNGLAYQIRINNSYSDTANGITLTKSGGRYASLDNGDWMTSGDVTLNFTTATGKFTNIEIAARAISNGGNWTTVGNTLKWNGTPSNSVSLSGNRIYVEGISSITFVIEMPTVSVTVTAGNNMTKTTDSGAESQSGLSSAMTDVVYTADDGYYFPTDYSVAEVSGIKVTRNSYTQITVSGTPTADATITLTAPTAKTTPAAPTAAAATDCTTADNNDGTLTGVTTAMEYKKSDAADWTAGTGSDITGLVPGTYYVRVKATDTSLASDNQQLTIKAFGQKETATVTKAPTAKTLTYNGSAQELVNAGEATGGEMQYALGTKDAATEEYTTSIPAKTDAGTYYVWYKAVGDETHTDSEAKCITVTISSESSGGGGGSSSGGSSSSPSTPTTPTESYTVPVSSENTVNVTTNISNGTAVVSEITQSDIDKIVNDGNNSGSGDNTGASENTSITIDVSQAKSEVTSVQLSKKTMEKLTEAVNADNNVESVEIKMTNATIELDGTALSAVSEQAEGSSIKLVVEDTQTTKLNATQQESLKQFASAKPFQAYFESNGKEIHDFKGGKATVSIKFLPESGRDVKHYHMYYLPVTGAIERYVTRYAGGMLSFVTTHFSDYAIVYDETMENETGKDTGTGDGSSETGDGANTNADGTVTGDNSESGNVDAGDESQTDTLSDSTANGKTAYQNAISINKGLKVSQTGNKLNISWGKVSGADRYEVYAAYCGKKFGKNPVKIVTGAGVTTAVIKKLDGKKLNLKKNFKVYVVAYKTVSGKKQKLGKTIVAHVIGRKNAAYTNIKAIKLEKSKATIKKGKTWRIKATVVLVDSSKKMLPESHAATFRYASSNKKIATVNKNGKVKAKKKGTCYIWIYAKNGCAKKIKVTVQ